MDIFKKIGSFLYKATISLLIIAFVTISVFLILFFSFNSLIIGLAGALPIFLISTIVAILVCLREESPKEKFNKMKIEQALKVVKVEEKEEGKRAVKSAKNDASCRKKLSEFYDRINQENADSDLHMKLPELQSNVDREILGISTKANTDFER